MDLRKELIDFCNWAGKNTPTQSVLKLKQLVDSYLKSINCALNETQAVRQNEDAENVCEHPFAYVMSKCNGELNKCLKCGKQL